MGSFRLIILSISVFCLCFSIGCDIPEPKIEIDFHFPDIIEECQRDTGFTEAQCLYMLCADIVDSVNEPDQINISNEPDFHFIIDVTK